MEIKTFEIFCENFSQVIQAKTLSDAIISFGLKNPEEAIVWAEDVSFREYRDQFQSGLRWVKASERLPVIDHKNPKYYVFLNDVNHNAICIWTEFINDWPPIINVYKSDWRWLDESGSAAIPLEDGGKEKVIFEFVQYL